MCSVGRWRYAKQRIKNKMRRVRGREVEWEREREGWKKSVYACAQMSITNCMLWYSNFNNLCMLLESNKMSARIAANWFELICFNSTRFNSIEFDFRTYVEQKQCNTLAFNIFFRLRAQFVLNVPVRERRDETNNKTSKSTNQQTSKWNSESIQRHTHTHIYQFNAILFFPCIANGRNYISTNCES